jgi:hypothetical protein
MECAGENMDLTYIGDFTALPGVWGEVETDIIKHI